VVEVDSNTETYMAPTVEELMKKLKKLNAELKKLKIRQERQKVFLLKRR
jgi:hypothetical protein